MLVIITYDIQTKTEEGRRRLSQVSRVCKNYGQRVQNSVFECDVTTVQLVELKKKLLQIINPNEDSLRIYNMGLSYKNKIEHFGVKESYDPEGILLL